MSHLKPVSVGAEEMSWADAGSGSVVDSDSEPSEDERKEPLVQQRQQQQPSTSTVRIRIHRPRNNSVSLPAGLNTMDSPDLQLTPDSSQHGGDLSDSSFTDMEGEGEGEGDGDGDKDGGVTSDEESVAVNIPLRSARRKSVMPPPPLLKINDIEYLDVPEHSPGNSITSINSIASLLKEKLALSIPAMMRKKQVQQTQEYKLHIFVVFLFLCIISLVGFAYIFYHHQVLQRAYFDRIRFNNKDRIVRVFNNQGLEIIFGYLGTGLSQDTAYRCLPKHELEDGSVCMEWMHKARFYMRYKEHGRDRCYRITWESLEDGIFPTDCYDWSTEHGHWYGGGQAQGMRWPIEKGQVKMSPFVTGHTQLHQWGNVLKRYFINSNGVTIFVDPNTPLYVSVNADNTNRFCLQARHDNFAYVYHHRSLPQLSYSICTSTNMTSLQSVLLDSQLSVNLTEDEREVINTLMTEPVWHITPPTSNELTESVIANYTEDVIALGFFRQGHVLLNEFWQANSGDFLLDPVRFPTMEDTIKIMQRRGFRIIFTLQPFVSTESLNFQEAVKEGLLVRQRATDYHIPALTRYKNVRSAGMLDITNNSTVPWLQQKLELLVDKYKVDAFYIDSGTAYDVPHYYRFKNQLTNPDEYKTIFTESILEKVHVVGVSSAITRPRGPVFVSLPSYPSTWEALKSIIPTVLTYGIIGYPLLLPGPIGGDFLVQQVENGSTEHLQLTNLPDKELYMRWMQLAAFLPVMSYKYLPSKYADEKVLEMAKVLTNLRTKTVNPIVKKYIEPDGPMDQGLPLIKPLWMLDQGDPACHMVVDEFSVGEELIVAPVLEANAREREVYLPAGVWKDGIDSNLRKGSRWLHHYRVPEDKVAFFVRMPDNTRF